MSFTSKQNLIICLTVINNSRIGMYIGNETLLLSSVKYYVLVGGKETNTWLETWTLIFLREGSTVLCGVIQGHFILDGLIILYLPFLRRITKNKTMLNTMIRMDDWYHNTG